MATSGTESGPAAGRRAWEVVAVAAYLALFAAALLRAADRRLLWFDEFFTVHLARTAPFDLFRHLHEGADLHPPLCYLATALAVQLFGETEWAVRLPAVVGGVMASLCLYLFVRRRRGVAEGFVAMTAVGAATAVWPHFAEARSYGLMIGLAGLALVCWQRAAEEGRGRGWPVAFGAVLALGIATHYYFVVVVATLVAAELARAVARRRVDLPVFMGFVAAGVMLAALYPLWGYGPREYVAGFWGKVGLSREWVEAAYHRLYSREWAVPAAFALGVAAVAGSVPRRGAVAAEPSPYPVWEAVALAAVAAAPAIGVVVGSVAAGGFDGRYTMFAILGLAGLLANAVGRMAGPAWWGCVAAAAGFAAVGGLEQWRTVPAKYDAERASLTATADLLDARAAGGTVVVESAADLTRLWQYAPARKFDPVFVADTAGARARTGFDTFERASLALTRLTSVPVVGYDAVLDRLTAGGPVYYFGPRTGHLPPELESRGVRFEPTEASTPLGSLYRLVTAARP